MSKSVREQRSTCEQVYNLLMSAGALSSLRITQATSPRYLSFGDKICAFVISRYSWVAMNQESFHCGQLCCRKEGILLLCACVCKE